MQCIFCYSAAEELKNFVTAYVTKSEYHPDMEKLRELLSKVTYEQKLDILQQTKSEVAGMTALHKAAQRGHADVLKAVLSTLQSSDRLIVLMAKDYMKRTPLHEAALGGHTESVKAILNSLTAVQQMQLLTIEGGWYGNRTAVEMASGETADVLSEFKNRARGKAYPGEFDTLNSHVLQVRLDIRVV